MAVDKNIEEGLGFAPRFDANGLVTAVAQDAVTGQVLMVAYMNDEALKATLATGNAVYYSRSRKKLCRKGEESGHVQRVKEVLVDCDQDCLVLKVSVDQGQCHVGYQSCFYRRVKAGGMDKLELVAEKVYDPVEAYGKK